MNLPFLNVNSSSSTMRVCVTLGMLLNSTIALSIAFHIIWATIKTDAVNWDGIGDACWGLAAILTGTLGAKAAQRVAEGKGK